MLRILLLAAALAFAMASTARAQSIATFDCGLDGWNAENGDTWSATASWQRLGPGSDEGHLVAELQSGSEIRLRNQFLGINGAANGRFATRITASGLPAEGAVDLLIVAFNPEVSLILFDVLPGAISNGENIIDVPLGGGFAVPEVGITEVRIGWNSTPLPAGFRAEIDYIAFTGQEGLSPVQDTEGCDGYIETFDCTFGGWVPDGMGLSLKHGRSPAPELGGRLEVRARGNGTQVFINRPDLGLDGTSFNRFAIRVEAPWLGATEELPLTAVAYTPGPTLAFFDPGLPPIVGPEPQVIHYTFGGGFLAPEIYRLDVRFGGASNPVPFGAATFVDWVAVTNIEDFEPAEQDTTDCGPAIFWTFDCDLEGWTPNPNLGARWEDRDGGKAILTFQPTPENAQFNPPGVPFRVNVDETPWLLINQQVVGTGSPNNEVFMLINTANQGFADFAGWSEADPQVQIFLPVAFSGEVDITQIRIFQGGGEVIDFANTELVVDYIAFAATQGAFPAEQDTEPCPEPVELDWPIQAVRIPVGSPAPTLDGVIAPGEWAPTGVEVPIDISLATLNAIDPYFPQFTHPGTLIGSIADDADLSARAWFLWDNQALYIAADVSDDVLLPSTFPNVNNGDAFQFAIDYDSNALAGADLPFSGVFIPSWAAAPNSNDPSRFQQFWPTGSANPFTGTTWAVAERPGGWTLEARIPWTAFEAGGDFFLNPFPPAVGQTALAAIILPDADLNVGSVDGFLVTVGNGQNTILDSSSYNTLLFVEEPTLPASFDGWMEILY